MEILHLLGRLMFGGFFLVSGLRHLTGVGAMKDDAASKGVPAPAVAVVATGLILVGGGLSVLLGYWPEVGLWLLIAFLLTGAFQMHNYWAVPEEQKPVQEMNFWKNVALAGAALMLLLDAGGWPYTLGG